MYIWKRRYEPFRIGGNPNRLIKTEVKGYDPIALPKGFQAIFIEGEGVFELSSGGLVGDSIETVAADICASDDLDYMKSQIVIAQKERDKATLVSNEEFFRGTFMKSGGIHHD